MSRGNVDPAACYVCGGTEAQHPRPGTPSSTHNYWSNADAEAEFAADAARQGAPRYSDGTTSPEAHYVATERPY